jgi:hypothetical protein
MLLIVGLALGAVPAQESSGEALTVVIEIERAMLEQSRARHEALTRRRGDLLEEIALLRGALDDAVGERASPDHRRIQQLAEQLERIESERAGLALTERLIVDRVAQHLERLVLFEEQLEALEAREERVEGRLTGTWDLVLLPIEQRGTAVLDQSGALVSGTYQFEGGFNGSLQGTLVNRKVFLVRIDSRLGKSMELEGYLSSDGKRIRGSWLNYELAGGEGATGQWTAERRAAAPQ